MKRLFFVLSLMATIGLGGLAIESASAQNSNSSTTMERHDNYSMHGRRHRRGHHRRRHRKHRRHDMHKGNGNHNM
jgi:hypothetical protein